MGKIKYRLIPQGIIGDKEVPLNIVLINKTEIEQANITDEQAIHALAKSFAGPVAINIFDLNAVTTTSDGVMVSGAVVKMAAADAGMVNPDFGILAMAEMPYSEELVAEEPHLIQWQKRFPNRPLYRGPDPADKIIPVHNVVISGRAANNNSATEMMNIVTMEEILFPILGQLNCLNGGEVMVGFVGNVISVGIGMTVAEKYGRIFPTRQFQAGETAHGSGIYAQTLKATIPCIVANKATLVENMIDAMDAGCVAAREIGCSPAILTVAKYYGKPIDFSRITPSAQEELDSVGCTRAWMEERVEVLSKADLIARADEIIPGVAESTKLHTKEFVQDRELVL